MKILIIHTMAIDYNGVTDCIVQYLKHMNREGMEATILSTVTVHPDFEKLFQELGCRLERIEIRKEHPLRYMFRLAKLVRREKFDLVHAHGNSATMFFDMAGAKLGGCRIRIAHGHSTSCGNQKLDRLLRSFFYHSYTQAAACGKKVGEWLYAGRKFRILPNGRELEAYRFRKDIRRKIRETYQLGETFTIGHVGRFNGPKNQKFALEVFAELLKEEPESHLVFMGDGALLEEVKARAVRLGVAENVTFTGSVKNIPEMLSAMDAMIFPSMYEGMPLVVLEWQAAGLPCIVSDTITDECDVTELVCRVSLKADRKVWVEKLKEIRQKSDERNCTLWQQKLKSAGFDIWEDAEKLREWYQELNKKLRE